MQIHFSIANSHQTDLLNEMYYSKWACYCPNYKPIEHSKQLIFSTLWKITVQTLANYCIQSLFSLTTQEKVMDKACILDPFVLNNKKKSTISEQFSRIWWPGVVKKINLKYQTSNASWSIIYIVNLCLSCNVVLVNYFWLFWCVMLKKGGGG